MPNTQGSNPSSASALVVACHSDFESLLILECADLVASFGMRLVEMASDQVRRGGAAPPDAALLDCRHWPRVAPMVRKLRHLSPKTPLVAVFQSTERVDVARALEDGVHCVLPPTVRAREALLQVRALVLLARATSARASHKVGRLIVAPYPPAATMNGESVDITPREHALLWLLSSRSDRFVERSEILDAWGLRHRDQGAGRNLIDRHMGSLRRKVRGGGVEVATVFNHGFRLVERS